MRQFYTPFIFTFALVFCAQWMGAQDINLLLENLTMEQKLKTLEYIRSAGTDIDQQIVCSFEQLNRQKKAQTIKYLIAIQPNTDGRPMRTGVICSRDTLNFGMLEEGLTYIDSVEITNIGEVPYSITSYQTACDCAVLKMPDQPVLPGEKAMVRIEFNSFSKRGKVNTGIVLQDNSLPNARTIIYVKGEVTSQKRAKKRAWED